MVQSQEPRLLQSDLSPVGGRTTRRSNGAPGHGDLYPTLLDSGILDQLIEAGFRYASVSNSDNLGCGPRPPSRVGLPAVARRMPQRSPPARRWTSKGWPIVRRRADGRLILRETAQTAPEEMQFFTDAARHPHARHQQPLVRPGRAQGQADRDRRRVWPSPHPQCEGRRSGRSDLTGGLPARVRHGAAIEVFDGARVIVVPRDRFIPVKTTNELALLRSDVVTWDQASPLRPPARPGRDPGPGIRAGRRVRGTDAPRPGPAVGRPRSPSWATGTSAVTSSLSGTSNSMPTEAPSPTGRRFRDRNCTIGEFRWAECDRPKLHYWRVSVGRLVTLLAGDAREVSGGVVTEGRGRTG